MDNQDQRGALGRLVSATRRVTRIVQIAPFVYLSMVAICLMIGWAIDDDSLSLADAVLSRSSLAPVVLLMLSKSLRLCRWHKAACILPSTTKVETIVDSYLFQFTEGEIILINIALGLLFLFFIYRAFKHFFHNGRKRNHKADA